MTKFKGGMKNAFVGGYSPDGKWLVIRIDQGLNHGLVLLVLVPAVVVLALFVWAARKDGQADRGRADAAWHPSEHTARTLSG